LRNEHRKESEHDRYADHHDGVFSHRQPRRSSSSLLCGTTCAPKLNPS